MGYQNIGLSKCKCRKDKKVENRVKNNSKFIALSF